MTLSRIVLASVVWASAPDAGAEIRGRVAAEVEYQGEAYRNEAVLDLPSPDNVSDRVVEVQFTEDTWLPGNRLEFLWRPQAGLDFRSSTGYNARRLYQELEGRLSVPVGNGFWAIRTFAGLREESRSFAGHGDWNAGLELKRQLDLGARWGISMEGAFRHSRTRGDTLTFVYDYDRLDATLRLLQKGARWDAYVSGSAKEIPDDLDGSYRQVAVGGSYRPQHGRRLHIETEVRSRDYVRDGEIGQDFVEADAFLRCSPVGGTVHALLAELELRGADYRNQDDLYYDFAQATVFLPWERRGTTWTTVAGPRARILWDTVDGAHDYRQLSLRGEATRSLGLFGFGQVSLEAGYRDYRFDAEAVEITSLSTTLLRSDYWLVQAMLLGTVPLGGSFALEVLADTALETHQHESERIQVTFVNLAVTTSF